MNNQINLLMNKPGYIAQNDTRYPNTPQDIYTISRVKGETSYRGKAAKNILSNINNK
jgi:hypothetical protein